MTKVIKQTYFIKSSPSKVWKALTDPKYIDGWGGGPAKMDEKEGSEFSLWGGDIFGTNTKVIKEKKLIQNWFGGKWEKASVATFILEPEKNGTKLEFTHIGVPEKNFKDIESGWKEYYLGPLKEYLEKK